MDRCANLRLLAGYNRWMNEKVYAAAGRLDAAALAADRGAFFGSILGTLNHLMAGDLIWFGRLAQHPTQPMALAALSEWPKPAALNQVLFPDFAVLREHRERLDALIETWAGVLCDADFDVTLEYRNVQGVPARRDFGGLVTHVFNHQTHHRGQVTTLLTQAGEDVGATDLLLLLKNQLES